MASFNVNDADQYGSQGGSGFLSLRNDKEVARVRFLFNGANDVQGHTVHEIEVDGKKRWVDCLKGYGDPVYTCPLCARGDYTNIKYFIPLWNIDKQTYQVWERGRKFGSKLSSICSRYPNIVSHIFEIERNGAKGDTNTTYEIYETGADATTLDQFEVKDPVGTIILQKTAEELQTYVDTGSFGTAPVQRRESTGSVQVDNNGGYQRRTPTGDSGRRGDPL